MPRSSSRLLSTALALGPAMAHLLELPNKIGLPRDAYLVVQGIYAGWNRLAVLLAIEVAAIVAAAWLSRDEPAVLRLALLALGFVVAAQIVFWTFTYPANLATGAVDAAARRLGAGAPALGVLARRRRRLPGAGDGGAERGRGRAPSLKSAPSAARRSQPAAPAHLPGDADQVEIVAGARRHAAAGVELDRVVASTGNASVPPTRQFC